MNLQPMRFSEPSKLWNPHADKPASIFVNMAYIRQEPSNRSQLIDSLAIGTPITFLDADAINPTPHPWHVASMAENTLS